MTNGAPPVVAIATVDRQLADGFATLRFTGDLERQFEVDGRAAWNRYQLACALIGLFLYDIFLISDYELLRDVFFRACINRLAIFTPLSLIGIAMIKRSRSARIRELSMVVANAASITLISDLFAHSTSAYRINYCHGAFLIVMFATIVQRGRFRFVIASTVIVLIVAFRDFIRSDALDGPALQGIAAFYVSGTILLLMAAYKFEHGQRLTYLLALRSRLLNEQLDLSGKIDPLTGLWNRRHLNIVMDAAWSKAAATPISMAIILLDIDYFKRFNDCLGHLEGDRCLQRVGHCLDRALQHDAGVAVRFGGEEFLVFVPGLDAVAACAIAERLRAFLRDEAIAHPAVPGVDDTIVTASVGVAVGLAPRMAPADLMAAADQALYAAKAQGRDCVRLAAVTSVKADPLGACVDRAA